METGKRNLGSIILTICILLFLGGFAVGNLGLAKNALAKSVKKELGFSGFVEEIQTVYTSDKLTLKDQFINVNGLFARMIGRRHYNNVVLTNNGMIGSRFKEYDIDSIKEGVTEFASYLSREDVDMPFLYVQAPYKEDLSGEMFPEGLESFANKTIDEMLNHLEDNGIQTLDVRELVTATPEMVENYFFRTDHHWKYDGAFVAYQEIAKEMEEMFPEKEFNIAYTDKEQWESYTLENWFLGSRGKRVGVFFAGVDDLTYYLPKFDTSMSLSNGKHMELYKGTFEDAIVRDRYRETKNYFHDNAYCLYIGGSYPVVKIQNPEALNDMKVVIIGDSFARSVYTFLSTIVSEVNAIDPRYLTECTVAEFVEAADPDLVLMLINPTMYVTENFYDLGVKELAARKELDNPETIVAENIQIKIEMDGTESNTEMLPVEQGKTYTLTFEDVVFHEMESQGVVVELYNKTTKKTIYSTVFDVEYCRKNNEFRWIFRTPELDDEEELVLLFYAGMSEETNDMGATYEGITLSSYDWK